MTPNEETQAREAIRLLGAVAHLELEHDQDATPIGYEYWDEVFEDRVQVTAWGAWKRDVNKLLAAWNAARGAVETSLIPKAADLIYTGFKARGMYGPNPLREMAEHAAQILDSHHMLGNAARGARDDAQLVSEDVYLSAVKGRQDFRKSFREERQRRIKLEDILGRIIAADDKALAEMTAIGLPVSDETRTLTEEARALLSYPAPDDAEQVIDSQGLEIDLNLPAGAIIGKPALDDKAGREAITVDGRDVRDCLREECDKPGREISYVVLHRAVWEIDRLRSKIAQGRRAGLEEAIEACRIFKHAGFPAKNVQNKIDSLTEHLQGLIDRDGEGENG